MRRWRNDYNFSKKYKYTGAEISRIAHWVTATQIRVQNLKSYTEERNEKVNLYM